MDYSLVVDCEYVLRINQLMVYAIDTLLSNFERVYTHFGMIGIDLGGHC